MSQNEWQIFFLSLLPVTELRVTIPLALAMGMTPLKAYLLAVLGNLIPIIPVMLLLEPVSRYFRKCPWLDRLFQKLLHRTRGKGQQVKKYGALGLLFFVAIPLPGTGAWTGAILAWLFGLVFFSSVLAISTGVIIAGLIVLFASIGVVKIAFVYDLEYIFVIIAAVLLVYIWNKNRVKP